MPDIRGHEELRLVRIDEQLLIACRAHQIAKRPSPWWLSRSMRKHFLSRMKNDGAPWLGRSVVSGSARQTVRRRSSTAFRLAAFG